MIPAEHPCLSAQAHFRYGRIHLPVAPRCNIRCGYCDRRYDCANESRPGVTSEVISPEAALDRVERALRLDSRLRVAGVAGPGEPLANPATLETLRLIHARFPRLLLCLSTNGLVLSDALPELLDCGVSTLTVTVNTRSVVCAGHVYRTVGGSADAGAMAAFLSAQQEGVAKAAEAGLSADLADQEVPVRHVFKADSDDALLPVVCQVDGLGGLDDAVPLRRIHLLHDVRSWLQARPDGHAVGAGHLLSDHGAAGTGGTSQVAELEGGPAQGLASDAVRLVYHDGVEGDVLKCQRLVSAALNIDLLGGRLLDGEAGGGFQLRHPVPAVPQALQHDLAAGVSEVDPQVVELAGVGVIAAVPELEFGPLDGAAGDAVYLLDGKGGLFVVLEIDGVVPVGIEGDQLGLRIHEIRGGNRFF